MTTDIVISLIYFHIMGLNTRKPVFGVCQQQRRRLICAFAFGFLYSIISNPAYCENFNLVSVAEETGLGLALSETMSTGFVASKPICKSSAGK